jgi:hypothetical protein
MHDLYILILYVFNVKNPNNTKVYITKKLPIFSSHSLRSLEVIIVYTLMFILLLDFFPIHLQTYF